MADAPSDQTVWLAIGGIATFLAGARGKHLIDLVFKAIGRGAGMEQDTVRRLWARVDTLEKELSDVRDELIACERARAVSEAARERLELELSRFEKRLEAIERGRGGTIAPGGVT